MESKGIFESNLKKAYRLIYGQCLPNLDQNLQTQQNWDGIDSKADVFGLIDLMKSLIFEYNAVPLPVEESSGLPSIIPKLQPAG